METESGFYFGSPDMLPEALFPAAMVWILLIRLMASVLITLP